MMNTKVENRSSLRVDVDCKLHCKTVSDSKYYEVSCLNISCLGISFIAEHNFQVGEEVEVSLIPDAHVIPSTRFFVKILRSDCRNDGTFAVGAALDFKDENGEIESAL
jgi:hypothetical protein